MLSWTNPQSNTLKKSSCKATYLLSHKLFKWNEQDIWALLEKHETSKTYVALFEKQRLTYKWHSFMNSFQYWLISKTYLHQVCVDTRCNQEDSIEAMFDMDGWWGRFKELRCISLTWEYIYIYIYIYISFYIYLIAWMFISDAIFMPPAKKPPSEIMTTILCYDIYIYIYTHPQTDCFIVSQFFSVARHTKRFKPGS